MVAGASLMVATLVAGGGGRLGDAGGRSGERGSASRRGFAILAGSGRSGLGGVEGAATRQSGDVACGVGGSGVQRAAASDDFAEAAAHHTANLLAAGARAASGNGTAPAQWHASRGSGTAAARASSAQRRHADGDNGGGANSGACG